MIKKLGNKGLLLILVALLAVLGIARYISNRTGENTFQTDIIPKLDSARIDGMVIFPKLDKTVPKGTQAVKPLPFVFSLKGKDWYVSQGDLSARAEPRAAHYMISKLQEISADRLASNSRKDWKEYNVNDSLGTRVVLLYGKDTALDVIVGRFSFNMEKKQGISYVRLSGKDEVYTTDGFLAMNIADKLADWIDRKVMPPNYPSWTKISFTYPADSGFVITRDSNTDKWFFSNGTKVDSLAALTTVKEISEQNYGVLAGKFDSNGKQALYTVHIESKHFKPVVLKAYATNDTANIYAINSSMNPGSFFSGRKNGMFRKVFHSKSDFLKKKEEKADKKGKR